MNDGPDGNSRGGRAAHTDRMVLLATTLGSTMVFLDGSVVNVVLPVLQSELGGSFATAQWVVEAYALFFAALLLAGGALGDRIGRKRVLALGVAVFTAASAACGLAPGPAVLIGARAVQGLGAAMLAPNSLAVISAHFPDGARGRAIGTWSGFSALASGAGPLVGGWLADQASWRWIFALNIPVGLVVLAVLRAVPESRDAGTPRALDRAGAVLATAGLGGVVYGLIEANQAGFGSWHVASALAAGAACIIAFFIVERRRPHPMLPLGLFRSRTFSGANLLTLGLYGALATGLFFLPFYLVQYRGYSPTLAGASLSPFVLLMLALSRASGGLLQRTGARLPLTIGPLIAASAFVWLSRTAHTAGYWTGVFPGVALLGLGMATTVAPLTTVVMGAVPSRHTGLAAGINNAASRVAGLLAIAALSVVLVALFASHLDARLAALDVPRTVREDVLAHRDELLELEMPTDLGPASAEDAEAAKRGAFADAYATIMLVVAGLAAASGLVGAGMIGKASAAAPPR
ncbi:MAG: MFS transporter [Vicinamibacterales bacterium]